MGTTESIEAQLDQLQRESEERRRELQAIAAALPQVTSRRAVLRDMARSVVDAPDKPLIVKRGVLKVLRTPTDIVRRLRSR